LFSRYRGHPSSYDELRDARGELRPHWRRFVDAAHEVGYAESVARWQQAQRLLQQDSLAYNESPDPRAPQRPWELDAFPLLLPSDEWAQITAALNQRAQLLDLILRDVFGPQNLIKRGVLPAEVIYRHPGFQLVFCEPRSTRDRMLHFYSADLARSPDGGWWILSDRTEAPSGAGFALENRIGLSRIWPEVFRQLHVQRLAPYFIHVREQLARLDPQRRETPRIVLLSDDSGGPNYFEDAYLARYLGYTLAQPGDLAVRQNQVYMKTLGGLSPVDVLYRRFNSDDCDPLEISGQSATGVAGLLQSVRSGKVAVANALGSGLVESPVIMAFLPQLSVALLGEPLRLPGVATWWCGDPDSRRLVLDRLDDLIIKPAYRRRGRQRANLREIAQLSTRELRSRIEAAPGNYVGQERVTRSTAPMWSNGEARSAFVALRTFAAASQADYAVMPGGLARVVASLAPLELAALEGERSKDAWVLADRPVEPVSLLHTLDAAVPLRRSGADLPSRVVENLYWLGRMAERTEALARILRIVTLRLTSEEDVARLRELPSLLRILAERGQIEPGFAVEEIKLQLPAIEDLLPAAVFDDQQVGTLRQTVSRLVQLASTVRDRMSLDGWRIIRQMDEAFWPGDSGTSLASLLDALDALLLNLAAFTGLVMESMTRTPAWRFLDLGRRLERGLQTATLVRSMLRGATGSDPSVLEALVEIADSLMTYRSRYLSRTQLAPVLDLLLTDETNPRSLAYQLVACNAHVEQLSRDAASPDFPAEQRFAMSLLHTVRMADAAALARQYAMGDAHELTDLFREVETKLPQLSDAIAHKYLIHGGPTRLLSDIVPT
jgi:uncharacterized circularly permuted ATP-grasp superfamily protein/uncharacterized alpha-E superfamily protein